ncbi:Phosphoribosylformylglycinamidine cyclo-ligase [Rickettsiales bacterium Ac37b]|nr:Phosphoribosylformylglycinamidine cyclo-ligase [Rickettsiales bacterium Ac37b]
MEKSSRITYEQAGVSITKGNDLVNIIKVMAKSTKRAGVYSEIGGFGGLFDLKQLSYQDPILVSTTDGVGTKLKIAIETGIHDKIGIDLVAMCVNDLIVQGAEPLFFLDYFATGKLDVSVAEQVVKGIVDGCKLANCALLGGETAEMPGMYNGEDYDLAGFAVGVVERDQLLPKKDKINEGDIILGIAASGVHSNGFSLIRKIMAQHNIKYSDKPSFSNITLAEILLEPTVIYTKTCMKAINKGYIKALAHITGGGIIENLPRVMNKNLKALIDKKALNIPELFKWIQKLANIDDYELFRTFNCGIGMIMIVSTEDVRDTLSLISEDGYQIYEIGKISTKDDINDPLVIIN